MTKHCVFTSHYPGQCPHEGLFTHPTLSGLLCALVYPKPSAVGTDLAQGLVCERGDFQNTVGETPERPLLSYCELLIPYLPGKVYPTTVNGTKKELHTRRVCLSCIKLFRRVHACLHVWWALTAVPVITRAAPADVTLLGWRSIHPKHKAHLFSFMSTLEGPFMRMQENTKQQLDKMNGTLNGQPVTETAEEGQREHSSTKPDSHSSSVNAKITRPPFGGICLHQAGGKKSSPSDKNQRNRV